MTTQEIAIKYGVPTPEACLGLDKKTFGNSLFAWYKDGFTDWELQYRINVPYTPPEEFVMPAPQMHEIAPLLPVCFHYKRKEDKHQLCYVLQQYNFSRVGYFADNWGTCVSVFGLDIQAPYIGGAYPLYNTAEAYAQLYIKLKQANLL
jgi:hypothetical protein